MLSSRRSHPESGQVTAFYVIAIIMVLGFMALSIDMGFFFNARRVAKNAADASALAGASALDGCYDDSNNPIDLANKFADRNMNNGDAFKLSDKKFPSLDTYHFPNGTNTYPAIYVQVQRQQSYLFGKILNLVST